MSASNCLIACASPVLPSNIPGLWPEPQTMALTSAAEARRRALLVQEAAAKADWLGCLSSIILHFLVVVTRKLGGQVGIDLKPLCQSIIAAHSAIY